jgi:hypothetical protein
MPTREQLFHPSQPAHPQSSIPQEHSIQPHLEICVRAPASSHRRSIHENSHMPIDRGLFGLSGAMRTFLLESCNRASMDSETPPRAVNVTPLRKVLRFIQVPRSFRSTRLGPAHTRRRKSAILHSRPCCLPMWTAAPFSSDAICDPAGRPRLGSRCVAQLRFRDSSTTRQRPLLIRGQFGQIMLQITLTVATSFLNQPRSGHPVN